MGTYTTDYNRPTLKEMVLGTYSTDCPGNIIQYLSFPSWTFLTSVLFVKIFLHSLVYVIAMCKMLRGTYFVQNILLYEVCFLQIVLPIVTKTTWIKSEPINNLLLNHQFDYLTNICSAIFMWKQCNKRSLSEYNNESVLSVDSWGNILSFSVIRNYTI